MEIDSYGRSVYSVNEVINGILFGKDLYNSIVIKESEEVEKYLKHVQDLGLQSFIYEVDDNISIDEYFRARSNNWILNELLDINPYQYLLSKCNSEKEIERIKYEFEYFQKYDLVNVLKVLIFLKQHMDKNNHICGVGRGSAVSLYSLYKIGIHKVDSLKYKLEIKEFFK